MIKRYLNWRGAINSNRVSIIFLIFLIPVIFSLFSGGLAEDIYKIYIQSIVKVLIFFNPSDYVIFDSIITFFLIYFIFTFLNLILNKFNFDWLLSGGWKHMLDASLLITIIFTVGYFELLHEGIYAYVIFGGISAAWFIVFCK